MVVVSGRERGAFRDYVRRGYAHGRLKQVCAKFRAQPTSQRRHVPVVENLPVRIDEISSVVRSVSSSFLRLQTERHAADYDHTLSYAKAEVQALLTEAENAVSLIERLDRNAPAEYAFLLTLHTYR